MIELCKEQLYESFRNGKSKMKNFISTIKEYSTRDFIYFFARESINMFKEQLNFPDKDLNCSKLYSLEYVQHNFIHKKAKTMLLAWDIHHLAYLSITNANDYRKKTIKKNDIGVIVSLYRTYENEHSNNEYVEHSEIKDIFKYMTGMSYEQFKYQGPMWTFQSMNRNYHILIGSEKINREKIIDVNEITRKLFGLNTDELLVVELIILWLCGQNPDPLSAPESMYRRKDSGILKKENLQKVIEYYSISYEEVRNSKLGKQIFYKKPFVVTKKTKETIAVNFYLVQMLIGDGLYWLIRDYYYDNDLGQEFINAFGEMFENYFEEIADLYLPKNAWHKIPVKEKEKSADYFLEVEDAVFLFELKSGLLGIGAKQQMPDIQQIDLFYDRNIKKAYKQLKTSEKAYKGEKPVIKIFLLYENLTNTQMLMSSMPEIFLKNKGYYIMTIDDLEMFLVTYNNNRNTFNEIVKTIVNNENSIGNYETVLNVLRDYGATENMHFVEERDYFEKIMKKLDIELQY